MEKFDHKSIDAEWQKQWDKDEIYKTPSKPDSAKKRYVLDMFPYPSGVGLHVGHPEGYTATDIYSRFLRMNGYDVLHPMGWDAFGLPAENYAIKAKVHPDESTKKNIKRFREQIKSLGLSYDWTREIKTSDPSYFKWTQWLFLKLYEKGLSYKKEASVNWCPSCQTVLANEQVVGGECERCGTKVVQKMLSQWFFKITDYADRLLADAEKLDWPEPIKLIQRNWIGKSEGVMYKQKIKDLNIEIEAYDSIPQTFMAQTFCVIAPEHPLVKKLIEGTEYEKPVLSFLAELEKRKMTDRFKIETEIEGIFTGRFIENPFGTGDLPLWIASYVVADYGTGIVNCSVHDERDFAFAKKYKIPLRPVMFPKDPKFTEQIKNLEACYHHDSEGILEQPIEFKGRKWREAREEIIDYIVEKKFGYRKVNYKLRDWLVSRQRYWGAPIPIIYCKKCGIQPVAETELPVMLPTDVDFKPTGESPLVRSKEFQKKVLCSKCGGPAQRDVDTMDTFVDSSWYFLRFVDPFNKKEFASKKEISKWLPVDLYVGGAEHAVMHLLYARFLIKALFDLGYLKFDEPFVKLRNQGLILGPDGEKMSKSRGNVINPDEVIAEFGADAFRMYEMFMGPLEDVKPWSTKNIIGVSRFLDKVWKKNKNFIAEPVEAQNFDPSTSFRDQNFSIHKLIKKITQDIEQFKFNTAIAAFMEFLNENKELSKDDWECFLKLLAPFAPHITEELWHSLGFKTSIHLESWPKYDENLIKEKNVTIVVQVLGRLRGTLQVPAGAKEDIVKDGVMQDEKIKKHLEGKGIVKIIFVPDKLINYVIK